jgi:beta-galactosidase
MSNPLRISRSIAIMNFAGRGEEARSLDHYIFHNRTDDAMLANLNRRETTLFVYAVAYRLIFLSSLLLFVQAAQGREVLLLDNNWRFQLGENPQAKESNFADRAWRVLNLPHDWSIEGSTAEDALSQGDGGYFPTGVGWYRRELVADPKWRGQRLFLDFEGVATMAEVWINGQRLGEHHYAYTPAHFDITDHVQFDKPNVIAVRVDNSQQPNSRWYTGSGIYRHVWLSVADPVHVRRAGVVISTQKVSSDSAVVEITASVVNESEHSRDVKVEFEIFDATGQVVSRYVGYETVAGDGLVKVKEELSVSEPRLWSPDSPNLYTLVVRILDDERIVDEVRTPFGIFTTSVSADEGFLLNGKGIELCGACVHHDNGPLGAAAFDRAEERRVELLKGAGFNAIRTAHNPPSAAFLNACDRLGMLVIDEAFDGWAAAKKKYDYSTVFADEWQNDLKAIILRDRNHPSVLMWSIGNEVFERGNAEGRRIAKELADFVKKLDPMRPVAIALNGLDKEEKWPELDPVFASLDVAGYNYQTYQHPNDHKRVPERVIFSSESYARSTFEGWEATTQHPYVIGDFVWSGIDYLGEAGIGRVFDAQESMREFWEEPQFPWHGGTCGDLDITCQRKPLSHYRQILWDRGEKLYAAVQVPSADGKPWQISKWAHPPTLASWTWPGQVDKPMTVEVYSRYPAVRLYLNDKLLGEKPTTRAQQFRAEFEVIYSPGKLRVAGIEDGKELESLELKTASAAAAIRLTPDRQSIRADGQDLSFIEVVIVDENGILCTDARDSIKYEIEGPGEIIAIGSGDLASRESYRANPRAVSQGRALVIVRSTQKPGSINLTATAVGLAMAKIAIESQDKDD